MLHNFEQHDLDLAAVFSRWYTGTTTRRMDFESSCAKISANSGVAQGCPLSACGFAAAIDPVTRVVQADLRRLLDDVAKLFAHPDDWHLRVKPPRLTDALALVTVATRSINLELEPSKIQMWSASWPDPVPP